MYIFYSSFTDHVDDIIASLFQYLKMLRETGPKDWIFKEVQACVFPVLILWPFSLKSTSISDSYPRVIADCMTCVTSHSLNTVCISCCERSKPNRLSTKQSMCNCLQYVTCVVFFRRWLPCISVLKTKRNQYNL